MPFSNVATIGFIGTNYNKVSNGDYTRGPVLMGQIVNAAKAGSTLNATTAKYAEKITKAFSTIANDSKVFNGISQTVNFVSNNINPLIGASCVAKVILADKKDREKVALSQGGCFTGMLIGEGLMKKGYLEKVLNKLPIEGKWKPVVKGILFVAGSLASSGLGQKVGESIAETLESSRKPQKFDTKA